MNVKCPVEWLPCFYCKGIIGTTARYCAYCGRENIHFNTHASSVVHILTESRCEWIHTILPDLHDIDGSRYCSQCGQCQVTGH